jgi:uncharacterized membrane protein
LPESRIGLTEKECAVSPADDIGSTGKFEQRATNGDEEQKPTLELGLVVTPVLTSEAAAELAQEVGRELAKRYPSVDWRIDAARDALVTPPAALAEIVDAARSRLLDEHWDLVVHVTELPVRISRRPVLTHSSRTHGAAVVSLPALGLTQSGRRLVQSIADAVAVFAGDTAGRRADNRHRHRRHVRTRLTQLATEVEGSEALEGVALLHRVITGNLRLVLGMVRANHPWQFVTRLTRALIGAVGVAAFAVITSDVWRIAAKLSALRLALLCLATVVTAVATLIIVHGLWERVEDRRLREQAILFNLVTVITLTFGMLALYGAACVVSLAAAALAVEPSVFAAQVGTPLGFGDYVRLAFLAGALATVGGALGGALESDTAVREAAYARRPEGL